MREWVELFDEPRPSGIEVSPFDLSELLALFQQEKIYVHCEMEVHTV